jgi:aminoglycoside phosphotransferase (APT) family kinase protein
VGVVSGPRSFHTATASPGLTAERAAAIIATEFPSLAPVRAEYLGEGCDSVAFVVNGELVFRFPKRDDVAEQLLREVQLLPYVARRVRVPIPVYSHLGRPSPHYPHPFGAYPMLAGRPANQFDLEALPRDEIAGALAVLLSSLHGWDGAEATRLGLPFLDDDELIAEVRADAIEDFELVRQMAPDRPLDRWHAFLANPPAPSRRDRAPVVVHADLAAEHLLFDAAAHAVTGVIDWSEIAVGDPAIDFAGVFHWGGQPLMDAVLRRYEGPAPDADALARARYLAACRGVLDVRFGRDTQRADYVRGGLRALELCVPARS